MPVPDPAASHLIQFPAYGLEKRWRTAQGLESLHRGGRLGRGSWVQINSAPAGAAIWGVSQHCVIVGKAAAYHAGILLGSQFESGCPTYLLMYLEKQQEKQLWTSARPGSSCRGQLESEPVDRRYSPFPIILTFK